SPLAERPVGRGLVEAARRRARAAAVGRRARGHDEYVAIRFVDEGVRGAVLERRLQRGAVPLPAVGQARAVVGLFVGTVRDAVMDGLVIARAFLAQHVEQGPRPASRMARRDADAAGVAQRVVDAQRGAVDDAAHEHLRGLHRLPFLPGERIVPVDRRPADLARAVVADRDVAVQAQATPRHVARRTGIPQGLVRGAGPDLRVRAGLAVALQDDVDDRAAVGILRGGRIRDDLHARDVGAAHRLQRHRAVFVGAGQLRRRPAVHEDRDLRVALDRDPAVGRHRQFRRRLQHVLRGPVGRARRVRHVVDGPVDLLHDRLLAGGD
ncbi:conserved hypothetical protein, partial [Ricinus communis]